MEESILTNSQALMNLETSAQSKLKEREHLQIEIVKLNTELLLKDFQLQLQNELYTMRQDMQSLKNENEELKKQLEYFQQETYKAVKKDRKRLIALENKTIFNSITNLFKKFKQGK